MSLRAGASTWSIVLHQLRKQRVAMAGAWSILFLGLLAIYAPLIASDRPFYYRGPGESSWPWLRDLFDRNEVTQPVDLFFNLAMFALPLSVAAFLVVRWALRRRGKWSTEAAAITWAVCAGLFIWTFLGLYVPDRVVAKPAIRALLFPGVALRDSKPVVDYHQKIAEARAEGQDVSYLFPPIPYDYDKTRVREQALPPDWFVREIRTDRGAVAHHPLGTEAGGRDVASIMIFGTRISMTIGVVAVGMYVTIGVILGALAGYFGGRVDIAISRLIEIFISFPFIFFVLTVIAVFESRSIFLVMASIGIIAWPGVARLVRGEFLSQRGMEYVDAARALGVPTWRVIFRHVLPNALSPVLVSATFGVAAAILVESSIAFLGLGDPTAASWGALLNMGRHNTHMEWLILTPGFAIFFTVTVFNMFGEGLRDAIDPKLHR